MFVKRPTMAQNKLLILYLLDKTGLSLNELQLLRASVELNLMNYFDLKECLFELCESRLADFLETVDGDFYRINHSGLSTLDIFKNDLHLSKREAITAYAKENIHDLRLETETHANYFALHKNEYRVVLRIKENFNTVFEISAVVYSEQDAIKISDNWKKNASKTYYDTLNSLYS